MLLNDADLTCTFVLHLHVFVIVPGSSDCSVSPKSIVIGSVCANVCSNNLKTAFPIFQFSQG